MKSGCPYICVLVDLKLDAHRITCCNVHAHEITAHEQCNIQNTKQRDVERIYSFVICTVVQFIVQQNKSRRYFMHTAYPNGDNKQNHSVPNMFFSLFNSLRGCVCVCVCIALTAAFTRRVMHWQIVTTDMSAATPPFSLFQPHPTGLWPPSFPSNQRGLFKVQIEHSNICNIYCHFCLEENQNHFIFFFSIHSDSLCVVIPAAFDKWMSTCKRLQWLL